MNFIFKAGTGKNHISAFTLAEVLITLTIIGVIAALTIPNLVRNYQETATVNKVKKFHSTLSSAFSRAVKEYGPVDEWGLKERKKADAEKIYEILFKPYFKINKNCGTANQGNCIANTTYKLLNNGSSTSYGTKDTYYKATLSDGAAVFWRGADTKSFNIFYDINGTREPNQWGKDLFQFYATYEYIAPAGLPSGAYSFDSNTFDNTCTSSSQNGYGCAAWLVYKGNMDYLHCADLRWNGKTKCK